MIHFLIATTGVLLLVYALLIFYYHRIWDRIPVPAQPAGSLMKSPGVAENDFSGGSSAKFQDADLKNFPGSSKDPAGRPTMVSVIIPARNEAFRIGKCLDSLLNQSYPGSFTEIIIVNDFSTDGTIAEVLRHPLKPVLINLSDFVSGNINSYKKKAIETGIANSSGELILCTDADCSMGPDWIRVLVRAYEEENLRFIAAPVKIIPDGSWLAVFQILDFISLQGITGAAAHRNLYPLCNGANLAYSRDAYDAVGGFAGIDHIASGDDMLLMKKIQSQFPGKTGYIKDPRVIVSTGPAENIRAFLNQRIRWASKISHYKHPATFATLALVFTVNACLLLLFISCFFYGHWRWLLVLLAFKTISEYFFVSKVAAFFQQQSLMKYFPLCQPFHIFYTVIAGSFGSFGKYEWKNRKVK
jgi:cellulose synthase/poly-beta-1,6-N-acetylglucosamine synthase-like glycosyltransferase